MDPSLRPNARYVALCKTIKAHLGTATGGSALKAIEVLLERGVPQERILFLNLVASPQGLQKVYEQYVNVQAV